MSTQASPNWRPVRATALATTVLLTLHLVVACTPEIPGPEKVAYVVAAVGIVPIFCLVSVGLVLAGRRAVRRWALAGVIPMLGMGALGLWLLLLADRSDSRLWMRHLVWALYGLLVLFVAHLVVGVAVAASGWAGYIRQNRTSAERCVAPDRRPLR